MSILSVREGTVQVGVIPSWPDFRTYPRGQKRYVVDAMYVFSDHSKLLTWHIAPEPTREEPFLQTSAIFFELWRIS